MRLTFKHLLGLLSVCVSYGLPSLRAADALSLSLSYVGLDARSTPEPVSTLPYDKLVVAAGTPLLLRISISNGTARTQFLARSDLDLVPGDFSIRRADGTIPASVVKAHRVGRSGELVSIAPAKGLDFDVDVFRLFPPESAVLANRPSLFEPGTYAVSVKLSRTEPGVLAGEQLWAGTIDSNPVTVTIEPLSKQQVDDLWLRVKRITGQEQVRLVALLAAVSSRERRFLGMLDESDEQLRILSIAALVKSRLADKEVISRLERTLRNDPSPSVRSHAAEALGKLSGTNSVPALTDAVASRQETSYRAAIQVLGLYGDERAIPVLTDVGDKDPEEWVRGAALESIRRIKSRQGKPAQ
jgi:hypothetical protein